MDEVLLCQRYSYATINIGANYSRLVDRNKYIEKNYDIVSDLDSITANEDFVRNSQYKQRYFFPVSHNVLMFNKLTYESQYRVFDDISNSYQTTKDKQIKRNFNNPFCAIRTHLYERSIIKRGDKIVIKAYAHHKGREFNHRYFRKNSGISSITFNLKTGNISCYVSDKASKHSRTKFRTNVFSDIIDGVNSAHGAFRLPINKIKSNSKLYGQFKQTFDDMDFTTTLIKTLELNLLPTYDIDYFWLDKFFKELVIKFVTHKKIKAPNEYTN